MMAAEEGVSVMDVDQNTGNNDFSGSALLIVIGETCSEDHKELIVEKLTKGLQSWDALASGIDINEELEHIAEAAPSGTEGPSGERVIQNYSEKLHIDILINPEIQTFHSKLQNLLKKNLTYRHIVYAGHVFSGSGSWVLQDDRVPFSKFASVFSEEGIADAIKEQADKILAVSAFNEGDWNPSNFAKQRFGKLLEVRLNPGTKLESITGVIQFSAFLSYLINPVPVKDLLKSSDVVGNIRFSRPTLYIFPGSQGDSALFGISGFNLLINGGYGRRACFWDFTRHLDRIDALLLSHLGEDNLFGASSVLERKARENVHPELGFVYFNGLDDKQKNSPNGDCHPEDAGAYKPPSLIVDLVQEGNIMIENMKCISQAPHPCLGKNLGTQLQPINLYHKVGHGSLDMYVLNPLQDNKDLKDFFAQWNKQVGTFSSKNGIPLPHLLSIAALLVWKPSLPSEKITRILFPGSVPQPKLFDGLDKLKTVDIFKHPECSEESLKAPPAPKIKKGSIAGATKAAPAPKSSTPTSSSRTPRKEKEPVPEIKAETTPRSARTRPIPAKPSSSSATTKPSTSTTKPGAKKIDKKIATKSGNDSDTKSTSSIETPSAPSVNEVLSPADSTETHDSALAVSEASTAEPIDIKVDDTKLVSPTLETALPVAKDEHTSVVDNGTTKEHQSPETEPVIPPVVDSSPIDAKWSEDASSPSPNASMPEVDQMREFSPVGLVDAPESEQKPVDELLINESSPAPANGDTSIPEDHTEFQSDEIQHQSSDEQVPILEPAVNIASEPEAIQEYMPPVENVPEIVTDVHVTDSPDQLPDPAQFDPHGFQNIETEPELPQKVYDQSHLDDEKDVDTTIQQHDQIAFTNEFSSKESTPDILPDNDGSNVQLLELQHQTSGGDIDQNEAVDSIVAPVIEPSTQQEPVPFDGEEDDIAESHQNVDLYAQGDNIETDEIQTGYDIEVNEEALKSPHITNGDFAHNPQEEQNVQPLDDMQYEEQVHDTEEAPLSKDAAEILENEPFDGAKPEGLPYPREPELLVDDPCDISVEPDFKNHPSSDDDLHSNNYEDQEIHLLQEQMGQHSVTIESENLMENVSDLKVDELNNREPGEPSNEIQKKEEVDEMPEHEQDHNIAEPDREPELNFDDSSNTSLKLEVQDLPISDYESENVDKNLDDNLGDLSPCENLERPEEIGNVSDGEKDDVIDNLNCDNQYKKQIEEKNLESNEMFKDSIENTSNLEQEKPQESFILEQDSLNISSDSLLDTNQDDTQKEIETKTEFENITDSPKEEYPAPECDLSSPNNPFVGMSPNEPLELVNPSAIEKRHHDDYEEDDEDEEANNSIPFALETPTELGKFNYFDKNDLPEQTQDYNKDLQQDLIGNFEAMEREVNGENENLQTEEGQSISPHFHCDDNLLINTENVESDQFQDKASEEWLNNETHQAQSELLREQPSSNDEFDPLKEWGEPMGLPSPAPTSDKNGTSKTTKPSTATRKMGTTKTTPATKSGSRLSSAPRSGASAGTTGRDSDAAKKPTTSGSKLGPTRKPASAPTTGRFTTASKENGAKPESRKPTTTATKSAEDAKKPSTMASKRTSAMGISRKVPATSTSQREEPPKADSKPTPRSARTARTATGAAASAKPSEPAPVKLIPVIPFYVDLTYIPHHGDSNYMNINFFRRIRARYYVYSALQPDPSVLESLLAAKQTWDDPTLETTVIPTYDTDALRQWMSQNREKLAGLKVDVAPSANRCTIQLQDHETSCAAYRLEF